MITIHGTLDELNEIMGRLGEITPTEFANMKHIPITTYEGVLLGRITDVDIKKLEWTGYINPQMCDIEYTLQDDSSVRVLGIGIG